MTTADQFVQTASGECWARVRVGPGDWQWKQITHEEFLRAARALDVVDRTAGGAS